MNRRYSQQENQGFSLTILPLSSVRAETDIYLKCRGEDPRYTDVSGGMKPRPTNRYLQQ
ncbi:MAG: hypothetical protein SAJ72_03205 [Jaaginema sp. PMC 1080.18]|nr:hypothetical protein [Jaaginema sp. PMC 1080.18]MEC4865660.1 hypothetical protein [Jaaginema sp. PMC 1078.18]